jgi:cytochrome c
MNRILFVVCAVVLWQGFGAVGPAFANSSSAAQAIAEGRRIAETQCAACHAVGVTGQSSLESAPKFRSIGQKYDVDNLAEALVEGIAVGHPDMPQFEFSPEQSDALIAYLKSIQQPSNPR